MANGQLQKMRLVSYSDISFAASAAGAHYDVLINPESYALTFEIVRTVTAAPGSSLGTYAFNKTPGQSLTFKFLFDGTGVISSGGSGGALSSLMPKMLGQSNKLDVATELNKLKDILYTFNGDSHQPNFVQLQWGPLHYNCTLQKMVVTFKLFNPDGSPLRAEAECTFISAASSDLIIAKEKKSSPDLTHIRTVKKGDTLALLCFREYGDSKYYYEVAKSNRLTDFKTLKPGTKLFFPPFAK